MIYTTKGNIRIKRETRKSDSHKERDTIIKGLDRHKGVYLCSSFEYPGRYTRWDMGFLSPPVEIRTNEKSFLINGLNEKGSIIIAIIYSHLSDTDHYDSLTLDSDTLKGSVKNQEFYIAEEIRSKKRSIFTLLRDIRDMFHHPGDGVLGLYGSFAYDLIYQFEDLQKSKKRPDKSSDIVLYIPDKIFIMDHKMSDARIHEYDFSFRDLDTRGKNKTNYDDCNIIVKEKLENKVVKPVKGEYANLVRKAKLYFERGDLFEVVPSQVMDYKTNRKGSRIFNRLTEINPSPYGFYINLGDSSLIGASPEMYVRVSDKKIETCPISGTIKRGKDAIEDYENIMTLLNSEKEESELTMCTDVDRNDKSRICEQGSVKVIGRRQIEKYSHLIHTVDHVEGTLRDEFDGIDAFITHMWAVTVTGAPKKRAVQWIEENEKIPREWYAGSVGFIGFDGSINTGLTLRTIHLKDKIARIRVGATLLYDSDPEMEEEETYIKAAAMIKVLTEVESVKEVKKAVGSNVEFNVLIIDNEDSFVHTLGDYFRRFGAKTETIRHTNAMDYLKKSTYDLVVLSPGPGRPEDFNLKEKIDICMEKDIPVFGVCLGLQGIVEYFGGQLAQLAIPYHGKKSAITVCEKSKIFGDMAGKIIVGRYHSLHGKEIPDQLIVTSRTEDHIVMSVEHIRKPVYGVQFHPESIMSTKNSNGLNIIENIINIAKECKNGKDIRRIS